MRTPDRLCVAWVLLCVGWPSVCADHTEIVADGVYAEMTCELCATDRYCFAGEHVMCPSDSTNTLHLGTIAGCVCDRGFLQTLSGSGHTCALGSTPFYYMDGVQNSCPEQKETIITGAHALAQCVCPPGTRTHSDGTCHVCLKDQYQNEFDKTSCKVCPDRTTTLGKATMTSVAECSCVPNTVQQSAPVNDTARACVCLAGFEPGANHQACVQCVPGKFKSTAGDHGCSDCPVDSFQNMAGQTSCTACNNYASPPTVNGVSDFRLCECDAGYTEQPVPYPAAPNPTCSACGVDTYKTTPGPHPCQACGADKSSPEASQQESDCKCNKGFDENTDSGLCQDCRPGTYKNTADDNVCQACPDNTNSLVQAKTQAACFCNAGHDRDPLSTSVPCVACVKGKFKALTGSSQCVDCAENSFSADLAQTKCTACYTYAQSPTASTGQSECLCNAGYALLDAADLSCFVCAVGTYATNPGNVKCSECEAGTYANSLATAVCQSCQGPSNSDQFLAAVQVVRERCDCNIGYRCDTLKGCADHGNCVPCEANTYNALVFSQTKCTSCQSSASSAAASTQELECQCNAGFFVDDDVDNVVSVCTACPAGTASDTLDAGMCPRCGSLHFTNEVAQTACKKCLNNSVSDATVDVGGQGCLCNAGFAPLLDSNMNVVVSAEGSVVCNQCEIGWYKDTVSNAACVLCNDHATSPVGSAHLSDCKCNAGYEKALAPVSTPMRRLLTSDQCTLCGVGSFSHIISDDLCTPCDPYKAYTTEIAGSTAESQCVCAPGEYEVQARTHALRQLGCQACPPNRWKSGFSREACDLCRVDTQRPKLSDATLAESCECNSGYTSDDNTSSLRVCTECEAGTYKSTVGYGSCDSCDIDTFSGNAATYCRFCDADTEGTDSETGQTSCKCLPGFTRVSSQCQPCVAGHYKTITDDAACIACTTCHAVTQAESTICSAMQDRTCVGCQPHSAQHGRHTALHCTCNAGYEFSNNPAVCAACDIGKHKTLVGNNELCAACQSATFADTTGSVLCVPCGTCARNTFKSSGCTNSSDVQCTACTNCGDGTYVRGCTGSEVECVKCGAEADTVCSTCPVNSYCTDSRATPCPDNAQSVTGSTSAAACGCDLGNVFSAVDDKRVCTLCTSGYCEHGRQHMCPANSVAVSHTSLADCVCADTYYQMDNADDTLPFTCVLCTSDASVCKNGVETMCQANEITGTVGGSEVCICKNGFSPVGGVCEPCAAGFVCVDGSSTKCDDNTDTQGKTQQVLCVCSPGFAGAACVLCTSGNYCPGGPAADSIPCREHSVHVGGRAVQCECSSGFTPGISATDACRPCMDGYFKPLPGNASCTQCQTCEHPHYQREACIGHADVACGTCSVCTQGFVMTRPCWGGSDTLCAQCDTCAASGFACCAGQFARWQCAGVMQARCSAISTDPAVCAVGQYLRAPTVQDGSGNADSECVPCEYQDTKYYGQTLHVATSAGVSYNEKYSCNIVCTGRSLRVSLTRPDLGCQSCETGNVLLKVFSDVTSCDFTCRPGYERIHDDCFLLRVATDLRTQSRHTVAVTEYIRSQRVSHFLVQHTATGLFAIVVGRTAPQNCRREHTCFAAFTRVSTLAQMGILSSTSADPNPLHATRVDSTSVRFSITDAGLGSLSTVVAGAIELRVSLVDVVTWHVVSQVVRLRVDVGASALTYEIRDKQLLPLTFFEVDVALLYTLSDAHVFQMTTTASGVSLDMHMRVRGMSEVSPGDILPCAVRTTLFPPASVFQSSLHLTDPAQVVSSVTYWRANADVKRFTAFFHLARPKDSDYSLVMDVMDVAAVRDVRSLSAVCSPLDVVSAPKLFAATSVWTVAGLGQAAVGQLQKGDAPRLPSTGQLGRLVTFLAATNSTGAQGIELHTLLAAHVTTRADALDHATAGESDHTDFTDVFRTQCLATPTTCKYEYINVFQTHDNLFTLTMCSIQEKLLAKAWLRVNFGVAHDAGHVDALCGLVTNYTQHSHPHKACAVLVNTLKYVDHADWNLMRAHTIVYSQFWAQFRIRHSVSAQ